MGNIETEEHTAPLTEAVKSYICGVKRDWWAVCCVFFIRFGSLVEVYLPGVIAQQVSCDLGLTRAQEGVIATVMYIAEFAGIIISHFFYERFGRRFVLILALYSSLVVTVVCALVPNYYMLLFSRLLVGLCVGLCDSTVQVYTAEVMIEKKNIDVGSFSQALGQALGSGWVGLLGYIVLENLDWRIFILVSSIPCLIPSIIILHLCLPETLEKQQNSFVSFNEVFSFDSKQVKHLTIKVSIFSFIQHFLGEGIIMLLPNIIRDNKKRTTQMKCYMTTGSDFLVFAAVSGLGNTFGRIVGFVVTRGKFSFRKQMTLVTFSLLLCYGVTLFFAERIVIFGIALGVANTSFGVGRMIRFVIQNDKDNFGDHIPISTAWITAFGQVGVIAGTGLPVYSTTIATITSCLIMCVVNEITVCTTTELSLRFN